MPWPSKLRFELRHGTAAVWGVRSTAVAARAALTGDLEGDPVGLPLPGYRICLMRGWRWDRHRPWAAPCSVGKAGGWGPGHVAWGKTALAPRLR